MDSGNESAPADGGSDRGAAELGERLQPNHTGLVQRWHLLGAACRDARLSRTDIAVLFVIVDRMDAKTGLSWPGLGTVAKDAGINRSSVVRAVRDLVRLGYLVRDSGGPGRSNRYRMGRCEPAPRGDAAPRREPAPGVGADLHLSLGADLHPESASLNLHHEPASQQRASRDADAAPVWTEALSWLTKSGMQEKQARSLIGKARKTLTDDQLLTLVRDAKQQHIADPKAWLAAAMRKKPSRQVAKPITKTTSAEAEASADALLLALETDR